MLADPPLRKVHILEAANIEINYHVGIVVFETYMKSFIACNDILCTLFGNN